MDPNANLAEQLRLAQSIRTRFDGADLDTLMEIIDDAVRLATLVQALDGWIRNGGFLPDVWKGGRG